MSFASLFAQGDAKAELAHRRSTPFWLAALALALFLPGFFGLPPMDRDEPRFAQATKQMLQSGDYVSIRFQNSARNQKPVGIYWLQAAAVGAGEALGVPDALTTIWLYRIPSLVGSVAAVLLTYWAGLPFLSRRTAALGAAVFASTVLLSVEARLATTDAVLCATVVAAMGAMVRVYLGEEAESAPTRGMAAWRWPFVFWTAIGLGVLIKGPITPMIPAFAALALGIRDRSARWLLGLRPLPGLAWAALIVAPWLALIMMRTHGAFLTDSLGRDMLAKAASAKEAHGAPPGTYFAAFWLTAWPMAPFAAASTPFAWRAKRDRAAGFLLAWLIPAWLLFELVPTKLPHYVLPLYPAIALMTALAIDKGELDLGSSWRKWTMAWVPAVALLALAAVAALAWRLKVAPGASALIAAPLIAWRAVAFVRGRAGADPAVQIGASALLAWLVYFGLFAGVLSGPLADSFMLAPQLIAARRQALQATGCRTLRGATTTYREPSLVFSIGADLQMTNPAGAARFLAGGSCRIAFVLQEQEKAFAEALPSAAGAPRFKRVTGFNFNRGRFAAIDVWTRGQ